MSVDGVEASGDNVGNGTYPLARPLFIYSDASIMAEKPQVASFIAYYLEVVNDVITRGRILPGPAGRPAVGNRRLDRSDRHVRLRSVGPDSGPTATPRIELSHKMATEAAPTVTTTGHDLRRRSRPVEALIQGLLFLAGAISILVTLGIVFELGSEAWLFFGDPQVSWVEFLTGTEWQPGIGKFGIVPLVLATLITSVDRDAGGAAGGTGRRHLSLRVRVLDGFATSSNRYSRSWPESPRSCSAISR